MRSMQAVLAIMLALTLALAACEDDSVAPAPTPGATSTAASPSDLPVIDLRYDGGTLRVEVAQTQEDRQRGLGGRAALAEGTGMLFDLGESRVPGFWMKDMQIAIDMVWIDENKMITGVAFDVQPQPGVADDALRRYSPDVPVRYVLEINAGASMRLGLDAGDRVEFELP